MTFPECWGTEVGSSISNRLQSPWPQSFVTSTSKCLPHSFLGLASGSCCREKGASRSPSHNRQEQHSCFIPGLHHRAQRAATAVAPPPPRLLHTPRPQPRSSPHRPGAALPPRQSSPEHLGLGVGCSRLTWTSGLQKVEINRLFSPQK